MNHKESAFCLYHVSVPIAFFAIWICFVMIFFHPVYLLISLVSSLLLSSLYHGIRKTIKNLTWQVPFLVIIAIANPFFSASGLTVLFKIGVMSVYAESLLYGLFMGVMLITMLTLFSCANKAISHESFMSVVSKKMPTVTLMISMAARLVPSLKRKASTIGDVQRACTSSGSTGNSKFANMRLFTVLMGWSMEDSLVAADAMKIAGWSQTRKRTSYALHRIKRRDIIALMIVVILGAISVIFAIREMTVFSFYPTVRGLNFSIGYLDFALFTLLPLILEMVYGD